MGALQQLASFFAKLISFYSFIIWIRIILSWINPYPRQGSLTYYFAMIVDPYLNLFRSGKFNVGMLDFSPLVGIGVLSILQACFNIYATYGTMRLAWLVQLMLRAFWAYGASVFFFILIIALIFRLLGDLTNNPGFVGMGRMVENMVKKIQYTFFPRRIVRPWVPTLITLAIVICSYFAMQYVLNILLRLSVRIPL